MSSRTQDKIYETFVAVAGGHSGSQQSTIDAGEWIANPGARTGAQIPTAKPVTWRAAAPATPNKAASTTTTAGSTGSSIAQSVASTMLQSVFQSVPLAGAVAGATGAASVGGIGSTIESIASTVLKSGLGMVPLIGGLLGLFGGNDSPAAPALTKYAMPASIAFEGADTGSGIGGIDYDQMGLPRVSGAGGSGAAQNGFSWPAGSGGVRSAGLTSFAGGGGSGVGPAIGNSGGNIGGNAPPQITVNVQAMDARSFLDRSSDIAAAVREAMLNMHSINDVVNEL